MINTYNDIIRNNILKKEFFDISSLIEKLDDNSKIETIRLLLNDYYKIMLFHSICEQNFSLLSEFEDVSIQNLIDKFNNDFYFKTKVVESSKKFNSLNYISKIHLMDIISKSDHDEILFDISKLYILDKIAYGVSYSLNDFKEYYASFDSKNMLYKDEDMFYFLAIKLIEYSKTNYREYEKMVLEFLKTYYKWALYRVENESEEMPVYEDDITYVEIINNESLEDIINFSIDDEEFLATILSDYLLYSLEIYEDENEADQYFEEYADEDVKRKLKIYDDQDT